MIELNKDAYIFEVGDTAILKDGTEFLVKHSSDVVGDVDWEKSWKKNLAERGLKYDGGKPKFHLIPPECELAIAEVLTFGTKKYAENSWKKVPNFKDRYYDSLIRHLNANRRGEIKDNESGLSHLAHAATCALFLLWEELGSVK